MLAAVLPMEPHASMLRRRWFEGWFLRFVDHAAASSVAVVFGSLRKNALTAAERRFDEHLLLVAYSIGDDNSQWTESLILDGTTVRVDGGGNDGLGPRVSWWSGQHGGMHIAGDVATLDLQLPTGLRLVANVSGPRVLWDPRRPNEGGPEGWLSRTGLLPCHYFVHTFGSRGTYTLRHGRGSARRDLRDRDALVHIERNWGDSFPTAWVWAQAAAPGGSAFFVLTGGRFVIGPLTTDSYVIGLRALNGGAHSPNNAFSWDFRTTDLDRVREVRAPCEGVLLVNATSRDGRRRLELVLAAPMSSFGKRIPVPTATHGFSSEHGCRESYTATAHIAAYDMVPVTSRRTESIWPRAQRVPTLRLRMQVPLAALEFGGSFVC